MTTKYPKEVELVTLEPIREGGDLIPIAEWKESVRSGGFVDYDGYGDLATATHVSTCRIRPSLLTRAHVGIPKWATHVLWYNR